MKRKNRKGRKTIARPLSKPIPAPHNPVYDVAVDDIPLSSDTIREDVILTIAFTFDKDKNTGRYNVITQPFRAAWKIDPVPTNEENVDAIVSALNLIDGDIIMHFDQFFDK